MLIVGGYGGSFSAEAVDMRGEGRVCESLPDYPIGLSDAVASVTEGIPVVCGDNPATDACYMLDASDPDNKAWVPFFDSLTEPRSHAIGVQLNPDDFLLLGGGQVGMAHNEMILAVGSQEKLCGLAISM